MLIQYSILDVKENTLAGVKVSLLASSVSLSDNELGQLIHPISNPVQTQQGGRVVLHRDWDLGFPHSMLDLLCIVWQ